MTAADDRASQASGVDARTREWRQGDCALGPRWLVHKVDPIFVVKDGEGGSAEHAGLLETQVEGLVLLTQTCDVVRPCLERPYVEVAPLVRVSEERLGEIKRNWRPQFAYVPGVAERHLVADLDRVMTVEKPLLVSWERTRGCRSEPEVRAFAQTLARKRSRVAFPDDFVERARGLQLRLRKGHDKQTGEGRVLRALREIRVRAAPSWNSDEVELLFLFVLNSREQNLEGALADQIEAWVALVPEGGRFKGVEGIAVTLADITAQDYVESDPLDLDHLSVDLG